MSRYNTFDDVQEQIDKRKLIYAILATYPSLSEAQQYQVFKTLDKLTLQDLIAALASNLPE